MVVRWGAACFRAALLQIRVLGHRVRGWCSNLVYTDQHVLKQLMMYRERRRVYVFRICVRSKYFL